MPTDFEIMQLDENHLKLIYALTSGISPKNQFFWHTVFPDFGGFNISG